jgi:hypothetical protein
MKNHKFAFAIWLVLNIFLFELLAVTWKEGESSGLFVKCFALAVYAYGFSFFWNAFFGYIRHVDEMAGRVGNENNRFLKFVNALTNDVLESATLWLWLVPLYYWMIRISMLLIGWIKDGEWNTFTTCDVIPTTCYFESKAVGLNKIINWIAYNDFGYFLLILCGLCGWIALKRKEQS